MSALLSIYLKIMYLLNFQSFYCPQPLSLHLFRESFRFANTCGQSSGSSESEGILGRNEKSRTQTRPRKRLICLRSRFEGLPEEIKSKGCIAFRSSANFCRSSRLASVSR